MQTEEVPISFLVRFEPGVIPPQKIRWEQMHIPVGSDGFIPSGKKEFIANDVYPKLTHPALVTERLETDPAVLLISTGVRHISEAFDFQAPINAWVPVTTKLVPSPTSTGTTAKAVYGLLVRILEQGEKPEFRQDGTFVTLDPAQIVDPQMHGPQTMQSFLNDGMKQEIALRFPSRDGKSLQLEHYFECRFAGRLFLECASRCANDFRDGLFLLDRLLNNQRNLAWTSVSLNALKKKYFSGDTIHYNDDVDIMREYMCAASKRFKALVLELATHCIFKYEQDSVVLLMLKVIWQTPFCTGDWGKFLKRRTDGTVEKWTIGM
ncbi:hypothetical protein GLOTRDRAFT_133721 [Gloeophyllum trabeum ATCC 11539]|uniref:Uncharacterized protein n=1 Tax=Gloeophyllum trabeum (strain ATCC 11539 / FP-39264 / Madison 617) TaxID=670483 RepID=S7RDU0_GLOTA|nr:uncharacterized protein GLOTRDRAFT_133721 [Gloeophyllum trabeum ATCC 11539]EPQ50609.1 hypothetical protein GLOTRDRAFT_133721 [Gloeophyllum trabeum ATCC 11539]